MVSKILDDNDCIEEVVVANNHVLRSGRSLTIFLSYDSRNVGIDKKVIRYFGINLDIETQCSKFDEGESVEIAMLAINAASRLRRSLGCKSPYKNLSSLHTLYKRIKKIKIQ